MNKSIHIIVLLIFNCFYTLLFSNLIGQPLSHAAKNENEKYVKLLFPRGTESFDRDAIINIEWESRGIEYIKIEYYVDGKWEIIIDKISASTNIYSWRLNHVINEPFKIRISEDTLISDISPFYLRIIGHNDQINRRSADEIASSSKLKLMPLGNSITHGYKIPLPSVLDGYRMPLKNILENHGLNFDFVGSKIDGNFNDNQHEGHGGWHSKHWYNNKRYSLADSLTKFLTLNPPNIILLHIGTNDIGEYFDSRNDNDIDSTVADISGLLDTIYNFNPYINVILARIINRADDAATAEINESDTTTALNVALQNMADVRIANGDNLSVVDMENALSYPEDLSDGVHPNDIGYAKMAQVWFDGIIDILPKLNLKIFLEGAFSGTNLNKNLNIAGVIPTTQPFNTSPWNYYGTEETDTLPANVVDWVLVSLREDTVKSSEVSCRAAFLMDDGTIVDLDGTSPLAFVVDKGDYYVVVEHRNHLPIMSRNKISVF